MAILYYHSRGYKVINYNSFIGRILYKHKPVIVQKEGSRDKKKFAEPVKVE